MTLSRIERNLHMESKEVSGRKLQRGGLLMIAGAWAMLAALSLTGCNTTEGAGKDIKSLGEGIEEAADDAKD
jgi:predicted small secreted protein